MNPQDIIRAAAKIIETEGWCSGRDVNGQAIHARDQSGFPVPLYRGDNSGQDKAKVNRAARSFSIYGAIAKVMDANRGRVADPGMMWSVLQSVALAEGVRAGGTNSVHPILQVNEQEGQTKDGILAFLERCAVEVEVPVATVDVDDDVIDVEVMPPGPIVDPRQRGAEAPIESTTPADFVQVAPKTYEAVKAPVPQIKADPAVEKTKGRLPDIGWGEP